MSYQPSYNLRQLGPYVWSIVTLMLIGILLRANHWLGQRAFWGDELALIGNLRSRDYNDLLGPLTNDQMAPLGFLFFHKWIGETLSYTELAMRTPSFVAGMASLVIFAVLAHRILDRRSAVVALLFFAISNWLVYYSAETKQYGQDVFFAVLLLGIAVQHSKSRTIPGWIILGIAGIVAIWFSHPVAFVLAGIGATIFWGALQERRLSEAVVIAVLSLIWLASFVLHMYVSGVLGSDVTRNMQEIYWAHSFMPLPPTSLEDLLWYFRNPLGALSSPVGFASTGLAAMLIFVGIHSFWSRDRALLAMLLGPFLIALLVSGLELYPFTGRFLLFSVPGILLVLAEGVAVALRFLWPNMKLVALVMLAVILFEPVAKISKQAMAHTPYLREGLPDVLAVMTEQYQAGDHIYLYPFAKLNWDFYAATYGLADAPVTIGGRLGPSDDRITEGKRQMNDMASYLAPLDTIRCRRRVWLVFAHIHRRPFDQEQLPLAYLDQFGRRVSSIKSKHESPFKQGHVGASAYLYEFERSTEADCQS